MMSPETIRQLSRQAARRSAREKTVPLLVDYDDLDGNLEHHMRCIPFIGDRRPRGYKLLESLFVDSSGFGSAGEPAMTFSQFVDYVRDKGAGYCYAIVEAGQFQVYIGVFKRRA